MITLTRFDGTTFVLNCDVIQYIEATPDTIIRLVTGEKLMVREKVQDVVDAVVAFKKKIFVSAFELHRNEGMDHIE